MNLATWFMPTFSLLTVNREIQAAAELEEARWVSPQEIRSLTLAPLLANHILPRLCAQAAA